MHKKDGVPETRVIFVMENGTPYTAKNTLKKEDEQSHLAVTSNQIM